MTLKPARQCVFVCVECCFAGKSCGMKNKPNLPAVLILTVLMGGVVGYGMNRSWIV
jgi:hypothetical protein